MYRLVFLFLALLAVSCGKEDPVINAEPDLPPVPHEQDPPTDPPVEQPAPGEYVLPLIETTDLHGYVVSTGSDGVVHYRLAYIADKAEDLRRQYGGENGLLLLDGGDLYQGASISNLLSGWPVCVALDHMGYDAVALGNHEFDWGLEKTVDADATVPDYEWEGVSHVNAVPVVCANLYRDGERVSCTRDYVIVEKTAAGSKGATVPVRIGIVGFAVNYSGSIITTQFSGRGFSINADYGIANRIAAELESSHACDATILLIHGEAPGAAEQLGADSPFDLVLGGHSHRTYAAQTGWGLPYLQGGRYGEHFGRAEIRFLVSEDGSVSFERVTNWFNDAVDSSRDRHTYAGENASDLSEDILAVSDAALAATAQQQNDVIGYITTAATTYSLSGSGGRASTMANWMCDILRRIGGADVAFVNSGGIRTTFPLNGQSRRDITVANIYEMFPFSNAVYVYQISCAELLELFEYSMTSGGQALFSSMTGIDCYFKETNYGSYSTYSVQSLSLGGTVIYQSGTWTSGWASRSITLAASEYLATTERTDYYTGKPNPLIGWNATSRLVSSDMIDNVDGVRVLREEASSSGGLLRIDTAPHFILSN